MSNPKTQEEINEEIKRINLIADRIPQVSGFGDDNRGKLDAQLRVLEDHLSEDDVEREFGEYEDEAGSSMYYACMEAIEWRNGDDIESPSAGWGDEYLPQRFVSSEEAVKATCQHDTPCADCPWTRKAIHGWLGGMTKEEWIASVTSESEIECHTKTGVQCAGAAIFRKHIGKLCRDKNILTLPADHEKVFSNRQEFLDHHDTDKRFGK